MGVNEWWTAFQQDCLKYIFPAMEIQFASFRFNVEDCANKEGLPDFSSLDDFSLHPELQVKLVNPLLAQ